MFPEEKGTFLLPKLSDSDLIKLKEVFDTDQNIVKRDTQAFCRSISKVDYIFESVINSVLGNNTWEVAGGHFFQSGFPYGLHSDGAISDPIGKNTWQTFVFPMDVELIDETKPMGELFVLITDQTWRGQSASFRRGQRNIESIKMESHAKHNIEIVTDYSVLGNHKTGYLDFKFKQYTELGDETVRGLTVEHIVPWIPGVPLTFPRSRVHCSSSFTRSNVKSKRALSIFTSRRDQ